ncbi:MAG: archaemetzincin family Zn-dependent metalloprotease [Bryobacteraceae bacterium]|nr:archaemetzincin family Zn-dependent metalloprotease [Bryobacteraceae bacterium]
MKLYVAEVGDVDEAVIRDLEARIGERFAGWDVSRLGERLEVAGTWDEGRRQFASTELLRRVVAALPADGSKIVGVTECDLFIPMLSFLFGQAQVGGPAALVSLARLRPEFYGLAAAPDVVRERARKECFHELGHAFGLVHCEDRECVMSLSTTLAQVDEKGDEYCEGCGGKAEVRGFAKGRSEERE